MLLCQYGDFTIMYNSVAVHGNPLWKLCLCLSLVSESQGCTQYVKALLIAVNLVSVLVDGTC